MSSNTFFGEVNELNSRAIYWSDNESDDESEESATVDTTDFVVNVNTADKFNSNYKKIYVCLSKTDKTIAGKDLTSIGSVTVKTGTNIADILAIDETSIWLRINSNHPNLKNHLLVKTISSLMAQIIRKVNTSSGDNKPLVLLISKDLIKDNNSDDVITYLASNGDNLSVIPSSVKTSPLLAPKMLNDLIESSVVEYCIVFNVNFVSIQLPEFQSNSLNLKSFVPKPVIDCVQQFNRFSDNNIYI